MSLSDFGARGFGKRSLDNGDKRAALLSSFGARGFGKRAMSLEQFSARGFGKRAPNLEVRPKNIILFHS